MYLTVPKTGFPAQKPVWTKTVRVFDRRTNLCFTQSERPIKRADLDELVKCFNPATRDKRKAT